MERAEDNTVEENVEQVNRVKNIKDSNLLHKLFDLSGTDEGTYKGFIVVYINSEGKPDVMSRAENYATMMTLKTALQELLTEKKI